MQPFPLTLDKFLRHAAKWHPRAEVVTAGARAARSTGSAMRRCWSAPEGLGRACAALGVGAGRPCRDAGLEHAGACRGLVCDHGHGRGLPHAQPAPHAPPSSPRWLAQSEARILIAERRSRAACAARSRARRRRSTHVLRDRRRRDLAAIAGGRSSRCSRRDRRRRRLSTGAISTRPRPAACASPRARPARPRA